MRDKCRACKIGKMIWVEYALSTRFKCRVSVYKCALCGATTSRPISSTKKVGRR
jgi:hypothetical protein